MWFTGPNHEVATNDSCLDTHKTLDATVTSSTAQEPLTAYIAAKAKLPSKTIQAVSTTFTATSSSKTPSQSTRPPSNPILIAIVVLIVVLIVVIGILLLLVLQNLMHKEKWLVKIAAAMTATADPRNHNGETSGDAQLYLQPKAKLAAPERPIREIEADGKTHKSQGTPLVELPAEGGLFGRQELRGAEHSKELEDPHGKLDCHK